MTRNMVQSLSIKIREEMISFLVNAGLPTGCFLQRLGKMIFKSSWLLLLKLDLADA